MSSRAQKKTLWAMLIAMLTGVLGAVVYVCVNGSLGYAIVMVGGIVMAVAIGFNIAISIDENRKPKTENRKPKTVDDR